MKKNPILIIVSIILLAALVYAFWSKTQAPEEPAFVGERSQYKGEELEKAPNFLNKEELPDGSTKYYLTSEVPSRPHMYVIKDGQILIQRSVTNPHYPVTMSDYVTSYGKPPLVKELKNYFDPQAKLYVYPDERIAYIANPQTQQVLEQHVFTVTAKEYLEKYSEKK